MINSHLKTYGVDELRTMLQTLEQDIKETRQLDCPGQTPEFWDLAAQAHSVREELRSKGVNTILPAKANLLDEQI
jgi:hypothetical protein